MMREDWTREWTAGEITCEQCGMVFPLYYQEGPMREKGTIKCTCGHAIYRYNGRREYYIKESEGKKSDAKSKK